MDLYSGIVCSSDVAVRRIVFHAAQPSSLNRRDLFVLPYDDDITEAFATVEELQEYEGTDDNGSLVGWN